MTFKLIATDMDGTFLQDDRNYDVARFDAALTEMEARGMKFVTASGNQYEQLRNYFAPVGADRITYVTDNGALVIDQGKVLYEGTLSPEKIEKVITWNREHHGVAGNLIILSGVKGAYVSNHATQEIIDRAKLFYPNVYQVDKFKDIDDDIFRVSFIWDENADVYEYIVKLREAFDGDVHVTGSGFGSVDVLAGNVNKAHGLAELSIAWDIKPEEMAAFGDNGNDLEMLSYVGQGFVMPNAEEFMLNKVEDKALNDNNHAGVTETIEAILAGKYDR
ncbi:Cof-type HAD-IIB family hydrolase [Weissella ceti]|uniref:Cof-type HAD-IIB family hydrolase n=1 Tax=Weissella ceti TaxID=759620 RepID=A0ABT3E560_9LACO|nr:HAD family hydrolase [Weissella ceti]MCW0953564.1 Cof-type HAD-IIB family hydrolase [Weissella ceti]QVK12215.1 HAD family phosphatase [Weissella ceti]